MPSEERLRLAVEDNTAWCDLVCRHHGVPAQWEERLWFTLHRSPPFYPDVITQWPGVPADDVAAAVAPGRGGSVKDSWADVDLAPFDYSVAVDGRWIWAPPAAAELPAAWSAVRTPDEHERWVVAAELESVLPVSLLDEPAVVFLQRVDDRVEGGETTAGAVLHAPADGAVGVSNAGPFDAGADRTDAWVELTAAARATRPGRPLVGWEAGDALDAALAAGWEPVGPLRVWSTS